jgi:dTDP-4-amino-4,6-dideoxygalactose transaminase
MRVEHREAFTAYLKEHGVSTDIHYPVPDHWQTAYTPRETFNLPETESACTRLVSLPCFPGLTDQQVDRVIEVVCAYFKQEI